MRHLAIGLLLVLTLFVAACHQPSSSATQAPEPAPTRATTRLATGPVATTIDQRRTAMIPQFDEQVLISLGDISRGTVLVSIKTDAATLLAGPTTMREGDTLPFTFERSDYAAELVDLEHEMIGTDRATFRIRQTNGRHMSETQKIEALIDHIASLDGATFIRNGESHTPTEAADHLRTKWQWAGNRITTAEQFIAQLATRSSQTGTPYHIRLADGTAVESAIHLRQQLETLNTSPRASEPAP